MTKKILFDEQGLKPGTPFENGQWKEIATHDEHAIKGFFGDYRFLSNFWPAKVFLDGEEYSCTENAYQAAKNPEDKRDYFKICTPKEAIVFVRENPMDESFLDTWEGKKLEIMRDLLIQKFDKNLNPELYQKLKETGDRYLEETNYWGDVYWGVNTNSKEEKGIGENNLGKLLMEIRSAL